MGKPDKKDKWLWVVVQDPGGNEQFLGQYDKEKDESFIPAFLEKENAQQGMLHLALEKGKKYEVQAVEYNELLENLAKNGFVLYVLEENGEIMDRIKP